MHAVPDECGQFRSSAELLACPHCPTGVGHGMVHRIEDTDTFVCQTHLPKRYEPQARTGFDLSDVIECAAQLVDGPTGDVTEEYRRGVVELATRICLCGDDFDDAVTVMGYAVCGVNKSSAT